MKKRGQFYLVAAIVIIGLIIGLAGVSNYVKQKPRVKIYDLDEELGIESEEIVQYGVFNYENNDDLISFLGNFTELYTEYAGEGKDLYFIYGDRDDVYNFTILSYKEIGKGVVSAGTSKYHVKGKVVNETQQTPIGDKVSVIIGGTSHNFTLTKGENFYYILAEVSGDETHILSSQE